MAIRRPERDHSWGMEAAKRPTSRAARWPHTLNLPIDNAPQPAAPQFVARAPIIRAEALPPVCPPVSAPASMSATSGHEWDERTTSVASLQQGRACLQQGRFGSHVPQVSTRRAPSPRPACRPRPPPPYPGLATQLAHWADMYLDLLGDVFARGVGTAASDSTFTCRRGLHTRPRTPPARYFAVVVRGRGREGWQ